MLSKGQSFGQNGPYEALGKTLWERPPFVAFVGFSTPPNLPDHIHSASYETIDDLAFTHSFVVCLNADLVPCSFTHPPFYPLFVVGTCEKKIEPFFEYMDDWHVGIFESLFFKKRFQKFLENHTKQDVTLPLTTDVELAFMAFYDPLTGLVNRTLFEQRCHEYLQNYHQTVRPFSLIFLDIDNFKNINDQFSHRVGDQILCHVSTRLRSCLKKTDTVGRFGGDEFAILLRDVDNAATLSDITNRIFSQLSTPFFINKHTIHITCSIGIACSPMDSVCYETLLHKADEAMYKSKQDGGGRMTLARDILHSFSLPVHQ